MNRIAYIDYIKSIAIFLVIFTHAHEAAGISQPAIVSVMYSIDRIGVPLFLIASGILTLNRAADKGLTYVKPRTIIQLFTLLIIYSVLTNTFYYSLIESTEISKAFIKAFNFNNIVIFGENHRAIHLWYLFLYIPLYVLTPFIGKMLSQCSSREIVIFMAICIALNQAPRTFEIFFGYKIFLSSFYSDFTGACLVYFIFGYWYKRERYYEFVSGLSCSIMAVVATCTIILKSVYESNYGVSFLLNWYSSSLTIVIVSLTSFVLLHHTLKDCTSSKIATYISEYSFGVYLLHVMFIITAKHFIVQNGLAENKECNIFIYMASASLAFPLVSMMKRLPVARWLAGFR